MMQITLLMEILDYHGGADITETTCSEGDPVSTPGLGESPRKGVWQAKVHRVAKSWTQLTD